MVAALCGEPLPVEIDIETCMAAHALLVWGDWHEGEV